MVMRNHLLLGAIVGLEIINFVPMDGAKSNAGSLVFLLSCLFGSVAPDLDEPNSKVSRTLQLSFLANLLSELFGGHRGFSHILLMPFFFLVAGVALGSILGGDSYLAIFLIGMGFGIIAHQIGDIFTKSRINAWSNPIAFTKKTREESQKEGLPLFQVGGAVEGWFITPVLILILLFIVAFQMNARLLNGILF